MPISSLLHIAARRPAQLQDVHFHRGPQGQPVPCYDELCRMPHMASADVREAAHAARRASGS
jgi:hypothetical protein